MGLTDVVLVCAAVGAGFGLAEDLLRYAADPAAGCRNIHLAWSTIAGLGAALLLVFGRRMRWTTSTPS